MRLDAADTEVVPWSTVVFPAASDDDDVYTAWNPSSLCCCLMGDLYSHNLLTLIK